MTRYLIVAILWVVGFALAGTGCQTKPTLVPMSSTIPDELTDEVEVPHIIPPPPLPTQTDLPQACFDRDEAIAAHIDALAQSTIANSSALAICNDNLQTIHRIHENTMVLPPGTPQ